jgi:hypothetical protein
MSTELAWAAGFYEGEGGIYNGLSQGIYHRVTLHVTQSTPATLYRFRKAVGYGAIYGPYARRLRKDGTPSIQYQVRVHGTVQVGRVLVSLWPYLTHETKLKVKTIWRNKPTHGRLTR